MKLKNLVVIFGLILVLLIFLGCTTTNFFDENDFLIDKNQDIEDLSDDSDELMTCSALGGISCNQGEECSTYILEASDSDSCCIQGECIGEGINCGNEICEEGEGVFNCPSDCEKDANQIPTSNITPPSQPPTEIPTYSPEESPPSGMFIYSTGKFSENNKIYVWSEIFKGINGQRKIPFHSLYSSAGDWIYNYSNRAWLYSENFSDLFKMEGTYYAKENEWYFYGNGWAEVTDLEVYTLQNCGNAICETDLGEDKETCPKDCGSDTLNCNQISGTACTQSQTCTTYIVTTKDTQNCCIEGICEEPEEETITLQSTTNWFGQKISIPNNQSFLDISIRCSTSFSSGTINTELFIQTDDSNDLVRYRKISSGENTNFYVDTYYYKTNTIAPKITFTNTSNCQEVKIKVSLNNRNTHFPNSQYSNIENISKKIEIKDASLGANDGIFGGTTLQEVETISKNAKLANIKFLRINGLPILDPRNCFSRDLHKCVSKDSLNINDSLYESFADRGVPISPVIDLPAFSNSVIDNMTQEQKESFLNLFTYEDNYYFVNGATSCQKVNNDVENFLYNRADLPDWLLIDLTSDFVDRYKNNFKVAEVLNEPDLLPRHILSCDPSCRPEDGCWRSNENERDFWKNRAKQFLEYFGNKLKQQNKTTILAGLAGTTETNIWQFSIDDWFAAIGSTKQYYDYTALHAYSNDTYNTETKFVDYINTKIDEIKNNFSGKVFINEFGYNTIETQYKFPNEIRITKEYIKNNSSVIGGAYYILTERDWMQYFPYWDSYGAAALFDYQGNQNWTFNQFYTEEIACTSFTYSDWGECQDTNTKTRTVNSSTPSGCTGGNPVLTQSCIYVPPCARGAWTNTNNYRCTSGVRERQQTRILTPANCDSNSQWISYPCPTGQICTGNGSCVAPTCTSFTYSTWTPTICPQSQIQTRTVTSSSPTGCQGGNPILTKTCIYCTSFNYSDWTPTICPQSQIQTRTVTSSSPTGCQGGNPVLTKTCTYIPPEICDGTDNDGDGQTDEGCDDDLDGYADASMQCPSDKEFIVYKYSDNYKKTCPTNDWCLMGNENWWSWGNGWIGLNNEIWFNYENGWISRNIPCSTNSGDVDDTNPSIH